MRIAGLLIASAVACFEIPAGVERALTAIDDFALNRTFTVEIVESRMPWRTFADAWDADLEATDTIAKTAEALRTTAERALVGSGTLPRSYDVVELAGVTRQGNRVDAPDSGFEVLQTTSENFVHSPANDELQVFSGRSDFVVWSLKQILYPFPVGALQQPEPDDAEYAVVNLAPEHSRITVSRRSVEFAFEIRGTDPVAAWVSVDGGVQRFCHVARSKDSNVTTVYKYRRDGEACVIRRFMLSHLEYTSSPPSLSVGPSVRIFDHTGLRTRWYPATDPSAWPDDVRMWIDLGTDR